MPQWLVFGEHIIGRVEASSRSQAERAAYLAFGQTAAVTRIQAACSYAVGLEEARVVDERRRPVADDD